LEFLVREPQAEPQLVVAELGVGSCQTVRIQFKNVARGPPFSRIASNLVTILVCRNAPSATLPISAIGWPPAAASVARTIFVMQTDNFTSVPARADNASTKVGSAAALASFFRSARRASSARREEFRFRQLRLR